MAGKGFPEIIPCFLHIWVTFGYFTCFVKEKQITSHQETNDHKTNAYQWCAGKCLITGSLGKICVYAHKSITDFTHKVCFIHNL